MSGFSVNRFSAVLVLGWAWASGILLALPLTSALGTPPNDHLRDATVLSGATNFVIGANAGATSEPGEPDHALAAGGKSVWWTWTSPFTGSVIISTTGTSFDTLLSVYTGSSFSNLQTVAENDDAGGFGVVASALVFRAYVGETFRIAVDGFNGATGTVQLAVGQAGYPAPAWSLDDLDDNPVRSSDFPHKVVVIDFWETTCGACVEELPDLIQLQHDLSPQGFTFFGLAKDLLPPYQVRQFAISHGINYGIAMSYKQLESAFGGDVGLPTKFIIDRENRIVASSIGGGDYRYYEAILRPLLRGSTRVPLDARKQGAALTLAWTATEFGYQVEATTTLAETNWTTALFPVVTTNDLNTVTVPIGTGHQFFRLRKTILDQ